MDESSGREIRRLRSIFWSERDPDGRAFPTLADAYRRAGDLEQALELLTDGLDRHPTFATGHVVAAWVHRDRSDLDSAEAAFRRVLELDEENVQALHGLGRILVVRGEVEEAQALLTRAAELGAATEADLASGAASPEEADAGQAPAEEVAAAADFRTDTGAAPPAAVDAALETLRDTGGGPSSLEPGALEVGAGDAPSAAETVGGASEPEVIEIGALAPDPVEEIAEEPSRPAEPEVLEIEDLAPDETGAVGDEAEAGPVDISDLAPDHAPAAVEDEPGPEVVDVADLAPDEPEPQTAAAGEGPPPAEEAGPMYTGAPGPEVVDVADLAPDETDVPSAPPEEEPSRPPEPEAVDVTDLAPDETDVASAPPEEPSRPPEPKAVEVTDLAPDETDVASAPPEEEPSRPPEPEAVEVTDLAPDLEPDEGAEEAPAGSRAEDHVPVPDESPDEAPVVAVGAEAFRAAADEPYEGPRTRTMAELYARQGLLDRAVDIYQHLVRERPEDREVRSRLEELEARKRGDQPGPEEDVEAMVRAMSAGDHAESTPSPFTWAEEAPSAGGEASEAEEPEEEPVSEWLGELLAWRPGPRPQEDEPPPHGDTLSHPGEDR